MIETELSFGQITFLLWVPPFLSYELWKLRIELSNLVGQAASKIHQQTLKVQNATFIESKDKASFVFLI